MATSRVALVTGSGKRRVGSFIAEALAARGYSLALHYRTSRAEADEAVVSGALDRIARIVSEAGGAVGKVDRWGRKRLAFEIDRQNEGYYVVANFTADPGVIAELERTLHLADEVLRFKVVVRGEAA